MAYFSALQKVCNLVSYSTFFKNFPIHFALDFIVIWRYFTAVSNMFSSTFYNDLALWFRISEPFYISLLQFDIKKRFFKLNKSPKATNRTNLFSIVILLWYTSVTAHNFVLYRERNLDGFNMGLVFQIGATLLILVSTITVFYSDDICTIANGFIIYFRYLHCT